MNSFVVEKENIFFDEKKIKIIDKNDINHIKNVLRLKVKDDVRVVDGEFEYYCEISNVDKKEIELFILKRNEDNYSLNTHITAGIGILKNDKMDLVIQKLTEIGITKIIPIITKRSVVKLEEKKEKWENIVKEAQKQCKGVKKTIITAPLKIEDLDMSEYDLVLVLFENEEKNFIFDLLTINKNLKKILFIIGPEGGFEEEEIKNLIKNGAKVVSLGKRILRAETAAIVTGGILANVFR